MTKEENLLRQRRKDEHVTLAVRQYGERSPGVFDEIELIGQSVPNLHVDQVDLATRVAGLNFSTPIYINAMTGGSPHTKKINAELAEIARTTNVAMAVGSESAALKNPDVRDSFQIVREVNPEGIIFGNVSPEVPLEEGLKAIELIQADALQIHVNPAQELAMAEGDRDFSNWLNVIADYVKHAPVPVIVKEVGFGMSRETALRLKEAGVTVIDVGGKGGTNFAQIENERRRHHEKRAFLNEYGLTTPQSLLDVQTFQKHGEVLASGGIETAADVVKCLALGAKACGIAAPILARLKNDGKEAAIAYLQTLQQEIRFLMVLLEAANVAALAEIPLFIKGDLRAFMETRQIKRN
ncbi:type 2 isopentenyl-diphosphate Delta-isomerase [Listeria costaricensis]|uniref:type 2 isopentenyl-diphosphate Delta-isomerase n=1 Tax=Listeria costaricensis TaxID=2026604 RepID=UPI000C0794B4|nr:type 2 isopentenyl-diphosphate Delta-isomerase [Listeria costaricensis]